jgi:hypothetical protein
MIQTPQRNGIFYLSNFKSAPSGQTVCTAAWAKKLQIFQDTLKKMFLYARRRLSLNDDGLENRVLRFVHRVGRGRHAYNTSNVDNHIQYKKAA